MKINNGIYRFLEYIRDSAEKILINQMKSANNGEQGIEVSFNLSMWDFVFFSRNYTEVGGSKKKKPRQESH